MIECRDTARAFRPASERYFQTLFTTKEAGDGTGLGLYICHEIVKRHGGSIDVTSERAGGIINHRTALPKEESMIDLIVVDDEEGVRRSLKKVLEADGYHVLPAENGEQAIRIVSDDGRSIETVISDYKMPGSTAWKRS